MTMTSAGDVVTLEPRAEWRSVDIADADAWTLRLTAAHVAELRDALETARSKHSDVLDVEADDFPLPTLAPALATIESELVNGRGFARSG